jgi:medium-chain acyl-[acyl-carrier-protein] hydrolase
MDKFEPWFQRPRPNTGASLRLFCFPFAGGGAVSYRSWLDHLPPKLELCALVLPGREKRFREKPFDQLIPLAESLADIIEACMDMPFAFFGHSLGTLIGFELTRHMRRKKLPAPVHFFVSGWRAPHLPDPDPPVHQLPKSRFIDELKRLNGTPALVLREAELLEVFLPVLRSDFKMAETYVYENEDPIESSITAFGGLHDEKASREDLEAWHQHTRKKFRLKMFPGGHFYIQHRQQELCEEIAGDLRSYC